MRSLSLLLCLGLGSSASAQTYDLVIYGGTSAGVAAAIQAKRLGKSVIVVEPSEHLGGLTTGGLGWTDAGNKDVIGGISREFYQRVKKHYDKPEAWKYEKPEKYPIYRPTEDAMWTFEPHISEKIINDWMQEQQIPILIKEKLVRASGKGVTKKNQVITSIQLESGKTIAGKIFLDCTYEGDLLAEAGVSFTIGREPSNKYGEVLNGVIRKWNLHSHRFTVKVDPYIKAGDPKSGLLPGIEPEPLPADGEGDHRMQAYCYRMCLSRIPSNQIKFEKPAEYDEKWYELLLRNFEAGDMRFLPMKNDPMPNGKTDTNNYGAVSTDFIGQNYTFPAATYAERDAILKKHELYQKGLLWTLANHPRVPEKMRKEMNQWGLPKDEFTATGGWPHQIYVREGRRMVSDYVMTEADCRRTRETPESVGMGSYNMDSHNCMRYVTKEGFVQNEGDVQVGPGGPYRISYKSLVPRKSEATNLLVPVCLSCSHIAYGSIRMEPVFMVLGHSAASAAVIALDDGISVQDVPYAKLQKQLLQDKQVLDFASAPPKNSIDPKKLIGILLDDDQAERKGFEAVSGSIQPFLGVGYRHDGDAEKGKQSIRFTPKIEKAGKYEIRMSYTAANNRATNVPVLVHTSKEEKKLKINQKKPATIEGAFISLGTFDLDAGTSNYIEIRNDGTDGHVVVDALWLVEKK
jgi:hypothetical protein